MTKKEIINYAKKLIKSKTIVLEIEKRNNELEDMDILYFLDQYSVDYETKLKCYKSLKNIIKDEYALKLLNELYEFEILKLNDFKVEGKDIVFEVIHEYENKESAFSMLFSTFKDAMYFIKKTDDPLEPLPSLIRKRYINIDIKKFECIYADMDVIGEVEVFKGEILKISNNNVNIEYLWYEYCDKEKFSLEKRKGIICGEYRPSITYIFEENEVVDIKIDGGRVERGYISKNKANNDLNPCSVIIDDYKHIICRYEDLVKVDKSEFEDIE